MDKTFIFIIKVANLKAIFVPILIFFNEFIEYLPKIVRSSLNFTLCVEA